jgi:hypothetical protein
MRFLYQVNFELHAGSDAATIPQPVTLEATKELFARISPNATPARLVVYDSKAAPPVKLTWLRMLIADNTLCLQLIDELWRYSRFVDPELAAHLYALRFSGLTRFLATLRNFQSDTVSVVFSNPDLGVVAEPYLAYYQEAMKLQSYGERFRAAFGISATYQPI